MLINQAGFQYFLVEGLYHTPQLYCTRRGNLMVFRDIKGREWVVDKENRRYSCRASSDQLITPTSVEQIEQLLREQELRNEQETARLLKESQDAQALQERLEREKKDAEDRE